jgi:hypothetical protein
LLDKKQDLLENLELVKKFYLKLIILKQLENDAFKNSKYENLHELSTDERIIVDDIINIMKYVVPDLVFLKKDSSVREKIEEIDFLHTSIIQESLNLQESVRDGIARTKKEMERLNKFPRPSHYSLPSIVNVRA